VNPPLQTWLLYVSEECELCDRAVDVLAEARFPDFTCIGIEGDAELERCYGERVPVLREANSGRELGWPFGAADVTRFLMSHRND
jgi:hypothetical protein